MRPLRRILVNPALLLAHEKLTQRSAVAGAKIKAAIYTRRQLLVEYTSQFRDSMIRLKWDDVRPSLLLLLFLLLLLLPTQGACWTWAASQPAHWVDAVRGKRRAVVS